MPKIDSAKRLPSKIKRLIKNEIRTFWQNYPIQDNTILFESFSGNGMLCHPEALFKQMLSRQDFKNHRFIWVINDFDRYSKSMNEHKSDHRVRFVKYLSFEYYKALSTSKYLINNVSFPTQFVKRPGQVYINTWHGIPLKKMGYDIEDRASDAKNIVRNFLAADYLLSSSRSMTESMYAKAFKMENIFEGVVIEEGSPRTDRQYDKEAATGEFNHRLAEEGLSPDSREVILYAPTWKGESYFSPFTDASALQHIIKRIESGIDTTRFRVMLKAHQVVSDVVSEIPSLKNHVIPNSVPTNVALGAASYLITDYSSIFFDFLPTKRPILFYIPDLMEYRKYRDLYLDPEDLPGPVSQNADELVKSLHKALSAPKDEFAGSFQYNALAKKYTSSDNGNVCDRVINSIFSEGIGSYNSSKLNSSSKLKLLIYVGGMIPNGITTSALNLLDNIDYEKYDVTVLCPFSANDMQQRSYRQVNKKARLVFRFGTFNGGYVDNFLRLRILKNGSSSFGASFRSQERLWKREWTRCFGDAQFDHIIDFSGYTSFWGTLFLHGPAKSRAIWMHNDLAADAHRSIAGNKPLKSGLFSTFSLYTKFDKLVSVSEGLAEINALSLEKWANRSKFTWSSNTINADKIRRMASGDEDEVATFDRSDKATRSRNMGNLVTAIIDQARPSKKISLDFAVGDDTSPTFFTFFSAGRLSPEKNHSRLIDAFGIVHEKNPQTRLVIAGDGPLRAELQSQIARMGLRESVKLVGHTSNPYRLMSNSDVFVLSSDYEGQPMVLLEALVLGLPVITTSFGSVKGALPPNVGTIVDKDAKALANAMYNHTIENIAYEPFDTKEYNERAMNEFYKLFEQEN